MKKRSKQLNYQINIERDPSDWLNIRRFYAGQALHGILAASTDFDKLPKPNIAAIWAYDYADAMIEFEYKNSKQK